MKNALIYLLLLATLLPSVSQWGVIAYYHVNKDYIARVLCQNRDKPDLHCDGKCYLAKKLKATQDKQNKQTTERVQNTPVITLFCNDRFSFDFTGLVLVPSTNPLPGYLLKRYVTAPGAFFQPPRA